MNREIKEVLVKIENKGFEAYVVGGYVRDKLLKRKTFDIDICTNALPKDLVEIFFNINDNKYGSCSFKLGKYNFDITTYRKEYKYINRKPTTVKYITSLEEDIKRRDFTINSLCMDKNGKIIDLLGSKIDLKKHIIKIIGDADLKFIEDPLRILRAIRFASVLNFEIESELKKAIVRNKLLVKTLSKERIKSELSKILLSKNYVYGFNLMKELGILKVLEIDYTKIYFSSDLLVMLSQLNLNGDYFSKTENNQIKIIKKILNYGKIDEAALYNYGLYNCIVTGEVFSITKKDIMKIYKSMWISESIPLSVTSEDIMNILNIPPSKEVGIIKNEICNLILEKKLVNNKSKIEQYLEKRK